MISIKSVKHQRRQKKFFLSKRSQGITVRVKEDFFITIEPRTQRNTWFKLTKENHWHSRISQPAGKLLKSKGKKTFSNKQNIEVPFIKWSN